MANQFLFGVNDVKIAGWNATGDYDALQDVVAISQLSVEVQTVNAQLEGDDTIVDTHAKAISARVQMQFGFRDREVIAVLTGDTENTNYMEVTARNYEYFGLVARIDETGPGEVCQHLFIPKMKINEGFGVEARYGQYVTPQLTCMAVPDNGIVFSLHDKDQADALAMPPVYE